MTGIQTKGIPTELNVLPRMCCCQTYSHSMCVLRSWLQESVPERTLVAGLPYGHIVVPTSDPDHWQTDINLYQHAAQLNAADR